MHSLGSKQLKTLLSFLYIVFFYNLSFSSLEVQFCRLCLLSIWRIFVSLTQSCKWNDRSLNRDRESRPRLGSDATFFGLHVQISKSTITFEFRTISVSVSPRKFLKRSRSSSFANRDQYTPLPSAHPQRILIWCVGALLAAHVLTKCVSPPHFPPPTPHFLNSSVCLGKDYFRPTNFRDPENWGVVKL